MFKIFNSFMVHYHEYATRVARRQAHQVLSRQDDRLLADAGFSRHLLEQGIGAWPWQETAASDSHTAVEDSNKVIDQAVRELDAYNDAELADLGISRGAIVEAVRHGRPGIERQEPRQAA